MVYKTKRGLKKKSKYRHIVIVNHGEVRLSDLQTLCCTTLWNVHVVVRAQVLDQVVTAREAIAILARAVWDRAVLEDRVVDGRLVSLQVGWAGEALAAVVAGVWFGRPNVVQLELCFFFFFSNWRRHTWRWAHG